MTREEAYVRLEETVGRYILQNKDSLISMSEWRDILSVLKGETNTTNLSIDDWNEGEIKVLKFMVRCTYDMLNYVEECDGYLDGFERNDLFNLCCKLGIESVT